MLVNHEIEYNFTVYGNAQQKQHARHFVTLIYAAAIFLMALLSEERQAGLCELCQELGKELDHALPVVQG